MDTDTNTETKSLPAVIGANYQAIRTGKGITQEAVASHARRLGLKWPTSKVGDFEKGRSESPFSTVLTALQALQDAIGPEAQVTLSDLVTLDGPVALTPSFCPTGTEVAAVTSGEAWTYDAGRVMVSGHGALTGATDGGGPDMEDMRRRSDLTEARICKRLKISGDDLIRLSWRLWEGRTFSEERDRRAVSPARRAPVSRELRAQLEEEIARGNH